MSLPTSNYCVDELKNKIGETLGISDWFLVTQENINQFGEVTHDDYWIHTDPARVEKEGIYDTTIAHGFFTLSLLTYFNNEMKLWPNDVKSGVNYGLNKVRWMAPVSIGKRIRNHVVLKDFKKRGSDRYVFTYNCTIEVEGEEKPAMTAEWLGMMFV